MGDGAERRKLASRIATQSLREVDPETGLEAATAPDAASRWFRAFVAAGGLVLDDRVWRTDETALHALRDLICSALDRGIDSGRCFTEFLYGQLPLSVLVDPYGQWQLAGGQGNEAIQGLFIREINRAHKAAGAASLAAFRRQMRQA